jgi:general secretion pathway protein D
MLRRPGDIPEFLCALVAAREIEKNLLFQGTLTMMFGRRPDRCVCAPTTPFSSCRVEVEYDGR